MSLRISRFCAGLWMAFAVQAQSGEVVQSGVTCGGGVGVVGTYASAQALTVAGGGGYGGSATYGVEASMLAEAVPALMPEPVVVGAPRAVRVVRGARLKLVVAASGGVGGLSFQWFRDGQPVAGATACELVIERASVSDGGAYQLRVQDGTGRRAWSRVSVVEVGMPTSFAAWLQANKLEGGAGTDPGEVGMPLLLRYATGLDALDPDRTGLPRGVVLREGGAERLKLTFRRLKGGAGVGYRVLASNDMLSWVPVPAAPVVTEDLGDIETVEVTDAVDVGGAGNQRRFLRLEVSEQ